MPSEVLNGPNPFDSRLADRQCQKSFHHAMIVSVRNLREVFMARALHVTAASCQIEMAVQVAMHSAHIMAWWKLFLAARITMIPEFIRDDSSSEDFSLLSR